MSAEDGIRAVANVYNYAAEHHWENMILCFHGGEPLLAGLRFYERVLNYVRERQPPGCDVDITIQSNLTLLDDAFISLFSQYDIQVSTSLDGPSTIHDRLRPRRDGHGTYNEIVERVDRLRSRGIQVGAICTMNRLNFGHEVEIFAAFKQLGIDFKANHVHSIGAAATGGLGLSADEIADSMIAFFDLWFLGSEPTIKERNTFEIAANLLAGQPVTCVFKPNCQESIICIEFNGEVFACDAIKYSASQDTSLCYGNALEQPFGEILASPNRIRFLSRRSEILGGCPDCRYRDICNGGCVLDSLALNGNLMCKSPMCLGYKRVFGYIEEALWKHKIIQEVTRSVGKPGRLT